MRKEPKIRKLLLTSLIISLPLLSTGIFTGCAGPGGGAISLNSGNVDPLIITQNLANPQGPPPLSPGGGNDDEARPSGQATEDVHGNPKKALIEGHLLLHTSPRDKECEPNFGATPTVTVYRKRITDPDWAEYPGPDGTYPSVDECGHFLHQFAYGRVPYTGECNVAYKYKAVITDLQGNVSIVESDPLECPVTGQDHPYLLILQPGYGINSEYTRK